MNFSKIFKEHAAYVFNLLLFDHEYFRVVCCYLLCHLLLVILPSKRRGFSCDQEQRDSLKSELEAFVNRNNVTQRARLVDGRRWVDVPGMCMVVMVVVVIRVVVVSSSMGAEDIVFLDPVWPAAGEGFRAVVRRPGDMAVAVGSVCPSPGTAWVGLVVVPVEPQGSARVSGPPQNKSTLCVIRGRARTCGCSSSS